MFVWEHCLLPAPGAGRWALGAGARSSQKESERPDVQARLAIDVKEFAHAFIVVVDLRERARAAVTAGVSCHRAAARFAVSVSSASRCASSLCVSEGADEEVEPQSSEAPLEHAADHAQFICRHADSTRYPTEAAARAGARARPTLSAAQFASFDAG
jgi:hypothetical protein